MLTFFNICWCNFVSCGNKWFCLYNRNISKTQRIPKWSGWDLTLLSGLSPEIVPLKYHYWLFSTVGYKDGLIWLDQLVCPIFGGLLYLWTTYSRTVGADGTAVPMESHPESSTFSQERMCNIALQFLTYLFLHSRAK